MKTKIYRDILGAVGATPLVQLNRVVPRDGATVLAKAEFMNPGGSVKDRIAKYIIEDAEARGLLGPGGTIVENTSGNTGVGLAMVAAVKGYRAVFTMPDKMSREKAALLRVFGAEVVITPTDVPPDSPESYYSVARRIARETPGAFYVDQYFNPRNIDAHYYGTGPEIWDQCGGRVDWLVAGVGTGGTLSGVAMYLKEKNPALKAVAVDPVGSVFYGYFKTGRLPEPRIYQVEGIGEDMLVGNLDFDLVDDIIQVDDATAFDYARRLCREEGLFAGGSSGAAVAASAQVAAAAGPGKVVVTILPDSGARYLSKFYDDEWLKRWRAGELAVAQEVKV